MSQGDVKGVETLHTIASSVSAWCKVLCVLVESVDTIVMTPLGGLKIPPSVGIKLLRSINSTHGVFTIAPDAEKTLINDVATGFRNFTPTCHDIDHIPGILGRRHVLLFLVANECLEHPDCCTVHVARNDANACMRGHRVLLQFLDEPVPLPL